MERGPKGMSNKKAKEEANRCVNDVLRIKDEYIEIMNDKKNPLNYILEGEAEKYHGDTEEEKIKDKILKYFQQKERHFTAFFPLVLRYMIQKGAFNTEAFRKYAFWLAKNPWGGLDDSIVKQAEYVVFLSNVSQKLTEEQNQQLREETIEVMKGDKDRIECIQEYSKAKQSITKQISVLNNVIEIEESMGKDTSVNVERRNALRVVLDILPEKVGDKEFLKQFIVDDDSNVIYKKEEPEQSELENILDSIE